MVVDITPFTVDLARSIQREREREGEREREEVTGEWREAQDTNQHTCTSHTQETERNLVDGRCNCLVDGQLLHFFRGQFIFGWTYNLFVPILEFH